MNHDKMKKGFVGKVTAVVLGLAGASLIASVSVAPAQEPPSLEERPAECPNNRVEFEGFSILGPQAFWTPAGASCVMSLEGAESVSGNTTAFFGAVNADGDLTATVGLTIVDNATGETLASCANTDTQPLDSFTPGLSSIAGCSTSATFDTPRDLDVTVTAIGNGVGNFGGTVR